MRREDALCLLAPGHDRALALDLLAEEADEHVQAADGEEEEGGDEREVVDVVREDRDRKSTRLNSSHSGESRMPSSA